MSAFFDVLGIIFSFLEPILFVLVSILCVFVISCFIWYVYYFIKGKRISRASGKFKPRTSILKQLFFDVPRRFILDLFDREPDYFGTCGLHIFCGEQGSGKTIGAVEMILRLQSQYPNCKTITNFDVKTQDDELDDWHKLLDYNNGRKGVICGIDEIQNWFKSGNNQLPEEMLEVVTQNRKNRRVIVATSQILTRMNKAIREQATLIYLPMTFLGCFTVVRVVRPEIDCEGNIKALKHKRFYCFVHTDELRESYDTYKVIHTLSKEGFKEQIALPTINNILVTKAK